MEQGGPLTVNQTFQFVVPTPQVGLAVCPQRPVGEGALLAAADTRVLFARPFVPRRASEALRLPGCWHFATRPVWRGRLALTLPPFLYGAALTPVGRCPAWGGESADFGRPRKGRRPGGACCPQGARDSCTDCVERHGHTQTTLHTTACWRCSVAQKRWSSGETTPLSSAKTSPLSPPLIV